MSDAPTSTDLLASDPDLRALVELDAEALAEYCTSVQVSGTIAQTVDLRLKKGQALWCARGTLLAYDHDVKWQLKVPGGAGKAMSRMLSGEGASLTHVTTDREGSRVVLSANQPGRLATWDLSRGSVVCTSGAFVAAVGDDVQIDVTVARSAGAAFFGGAGLFMQKLSGRGVVVIHGAGDFIAHRLGPGEKLLVSTGNLACFSDGTRYGIRGVGGCLKSLFGGEGVFMTELTGPGWVMLQSLKKLPMVKSKGGAV